MHVCVCVCVGVLVCVKERERRRRRRVGGRKFALHGCVAGRCEAADEHVPIDVLFFGMLCTRWEEGVGVGGSARGINMTLPPPPAPLKLNY